MKKRYLSSVAGVALASILGSAGSAKAQIPNWAGSYIGVYAGGVWGRSDAATTSDCTATGYYCTTTFGAANAASVDTSGSGALSGDGFTGGIQIGHNWQTNNAVYGVEFDFGAFDLNGSRQASGVYPAGTPAGVIGATYTVGSSFDTDWLATLRGRFGWTINSLLAYVTGGIAATNLTVSNNFTDNYTAPNASSSTSKIKIGWVLGGGLEWALNARWTIKGEYLYVNFGDVTTTTTFAPVVGVFAYSQGISTASDLTAHIARLGVNLRF